MLQKLIPVFPIAMLIFAPNVYACGSNSNANQASSTAPPASTLPPLIHLVRMPPTYPPSAQAEGVEGDVTIFFSVRADGSVGTINDTETKFWTTDGSKPDTQAEKDIKDSAINTIKGWTFEPYQVDGRPQNTTACQTFHFRM